MGIRRFMDRTAEEHEMKGNLSLANPTWSLIILLGLFLMGSVLMTVAAIG